jgi:hypothetical protein
MLKITRIEDHPTVELPKLFEDAVARRRKGRRKHGGRRRHRGM